MECAAGDPDAASRRLDLIKNLRILAINDEVVRLSEIYAGVLDLPERSKIDALHMAFAVHYETDYLLTWNCRHLAHGEVRTAIHKYNGAHGMFEPMIVTPMELMERSRNDV